MNNKPMRTKLDDVRANMGLRTGPPILYFEELEDDTKLRFPTDDYSDGINTLSACTTDFTHGLAIIAGLPNSGKSTFFVNMIVGILKQNPDAMVLDFAFDDGIDKRYQQLMACLTGLTYQQITTKTNLTDAQIEKKAQADELINSWCDDDKWLCFEPEEEMVDEDDDGNNTTREVFMTRPKNTISKIKDTRAQYPDRQIVVIIDAIHDFQLSSDRNGEYTALESVVRDLKSMSKKHQIKVWINGHLNKSTVRGQESLSDVKGSNFANYGAVWGGIVINDYLSNPITTQMVMEVAGRIIAVIAVTNPKNKVSQFRDTLYYGIDSFRCQIVPLSRFQYEEYSRAYLNIVNSSKKIT